MADRDLRMKLSLDSKDAVSGLKDVVKATQAAGVEFDDSRAKGAQLADELNAKAAEMKAAINGDKAAAEALGQALGPELSAKMGQGGLDEAVAKFKSFGLTADDVKVSATELAGSIRNLDDVAKSAGGGVDHVATSSHSAASGVDELGKSAGSSKSVLANMVGNSAQDLSQLGGLAGSAGVAVGQMGEYMADALGSGEKLGSTLLNFGKVAGPLAALGVGVALVASALEDSAKVKFDKKQVEDYTKAIAGLRKEADGAAPAVGDFFDQIRTKALETNDLKGVTNFSDDVKNLLPLMAKAGVGLGDYLSIVRDGQPALMAVSNAVAVNGTATKEQTQVLEAAMNAHANYATALATDARNNDLNTSSVTAAGQALSSTTATVVAFGGASLEARDAAFALGRAIEDKATKAASDLADQMDATRRAGEALQGQWDALKGSVSDDQAFIDVKNQFDQVHASSTAAWDAASSGAADAEQKARANASAVDELKSKVIDYGKEVLGLPPERVTKMLAEIDQGSADAVERQLAILTRNRTMVIDIQSRGGAGVFNARPNTTTNPNNAAAGGGSFVAGDEVLVGEKGPERVVFGAAGTVIPHGQTGGDTFNVYVRQWSDRELANMRQRAARRGFRAA